MGQSAFFSFAEYFYQSQFIFEMVEDDDIFIKDIQYIRCIIHFIVTLFDWNMFEVFYGIKCGISIKTICFPMFSCHLEKGDKSVDSLFHSECLCQWLFFPAIVGTDGSNNIVVDTDTRQGAKGNVRHGVFSGMEIRTFH